MTLLAVASILTAIIILLPKESTSAPKMFLVEIFGSDGSTQLHLVKTKDKAIKTSGEQWIDMADFGSEENDKDYTDLGSDENEGQAYDWFGLVWFKL